MGQSWRKFSCPSPVVLAVGVYAARDRMARIVGGEVVCTPFAGDVCDSP